MWICKCGTQLSDEVQFCYNCGMQRVVEQEKQWFYTMAGQRFGPMTLNAMIENINNEIVAADTPVWSVGMTEWQPAIDTELKQFIVNVVPKVQSCSISDRWAWLLACVPAANILMFCIGVTEPLLTILVIGLNCLFVGLDIAYLKRAGYKSAAWLYMGFLLVPVYLFMRAIKTNKHFAYAIVWCALFTLSMLPIWYVW